MTDCREPATRSEAIVTAAQQLQRGRIAVVPDQAMYLLVADAFSDYGVNRLRVTKGRADTPLTVLVGKLGTVDGIAAAIPAYARDLMAAFWPGPLTVVLRQQTTLDWPLRAPGVSVRMPLHPLALELVRAVGPTASTSANRAGMPAVAGIEAAVDEFDSDADVYLDAGPSQAAPRSTIVDATGPHPVILRPGAISAERLEAVSPALEIRPG